ncbi:hypothetical protein L248_2398 [Schleiferilactobacillus shenzhenensis LY-73]|uniref:Uncharacterized protein n=1 Tax=Schleiferilactobacillus shenzhenensis LY-73 TaxID=1231336 RepID=U4TWF0_9LACO|nr:hypothetical protein L248_2398 [Schleiferilactobacillus shenzhenensis LY-73]
MRYTQGGTGIEVSPVTTRRHEQQRQSTSTEAKPLPEHDNEVQKIITAMFINAIDSDWF